MDQIRQTEETVYRYLLRHEMVQKGQHVLLAVSGGADSVCLFSLFLALRERLGIRISVAHVNHHLRETAGRDEEFVRMLCKKEGVKFFALDADVTGYAKEQKLGTEEAARELRYQVLYQTLEQVGGDVLAVAHHQSDQAETLLFSLCRGSGIRGMAGIRPRSGKLIRPLLCLSKEQVDAYLSEKHLDFVVDETNADMAYTRNRIRALILPELCEQVNSRTVDHMAKTADLMRQVSDYLEDRAEEAKTECLANTEDLSGAVSALSIDKLSSYPPFLQREILRLCIIQTAGQKKDVGSVHIEAVFALLSNTSGSRANLPYQVSVVKNYDRLCFYSGEPDAKLSAGQDSLIPLPDEETLLEQQDGVQVSFAGCTFTVSLFCPEPGSGFEKNIPRKGYTKWLDYGKIKGSAGLRMAMSDDFFYFDAAHRKTAKDYFKDNKIPQPARLSQIVLADEDHILCFLPGRICNSVKVTEQTRRILVIDGIPDQKKRGNEDGR